MPTPSLPPLERACRAPASGTLTMCAAAATLLSPVTASAQDTSATVGRLPTVEVTVTRETSRSTLELPYAITAVYPDSLRPGTRRLALDEVLLLIPGVAVANRNNPTQDPRITIRGFGSRSAFGVRGVRVLRDGIPLTLPDGQTPVDYLDLDSIESIEVIRGTASALYGNASGGVIDMRSGVAPLGRLAGRARFSGGSYGLQRWHGMVGGTSGALSYQGSVTQSETDGFRAHAGQQTTHAVGRAELRRGGTTWALHALAFDMPEADNPGALTATELAANPRGAEPNIVRKGARKDVSQAQLGLTAARAGERVDLFASLFGGARDLDNPLAFGIVAVERVSYGGSARASMPATLFGASHRLTAGVDVQRMDDDRFQYANCNDGANAPLDCATPSGSERGELQRSQRELVTSAGVYLREEVELSSRLSLSAGIRHDVITFDVRDRFVTATDSNDSGRRSLPAWSPMVGLVARLGALTSAYANVTRSFETPSATEMGNQPDGRAGFNSELDPQTATTVEAGLKGLFLSAVAYDAAMFFTRGKDELIPFEIEGGGGRRYFRNAGETERRGFELGLRGDAGPLRLGASYSYSDFEFADFRVTTGTVTSVYDGNRIPGIPTHQAQGSIAWVGSMVNATVEAIAAGRVPVNDANTTSAAGYGVFNVRVGANVSVGGARLNPVFGVQNILDRAYVGSVSVNASPAAGRYFEPAPPRTFYAAFTVETGR